MPIPRAEIQPRRQTVTPAGIDEFSNDVALSALPGAGFHRVIRRPCRPKAKTVVMLGGENHPPRPRGLGGAGPLVCIKMRRTKKMRICAAVAPLLIRERVYAKMNKDYQFAALPCQLTRQRQRQNGSDDG